MTTWRYRLRHRAFRYSGPITATAGGVGEADRPRVGASVVRQQVTVRRWRDIWLHEGFACYAEWLWSEKPGGLTAEEQARLYYQKLIDSPQDLVLADPGPRDMFDDRCTSRAPSPRTRCAESSGTTNSALLRDWATRYRHATVVTDDFTGFAANYADVSLRSLWDDWLYSTEVPPPDRCGRPGERHPGGRATVMSALCGYAVLYLAARNPTRAGFRFSRCSGAPSGWWAARHTVFQEATWRYAPLARLSRRRTACAPDAVGGGRGVLRRR